MSPKIDLKSTRQILSKLMITVQLTKLKYFKLAIGFYLATANMMCQAFKKDKKKGSLSGAVIVTDKHEVWDFMGIWALHGTVLRNGQLSHKHCIGSIFRQK